MSEKPEMDPMQGTPGVECSSLGEVRVPSLSLFPQSVEKVSKRVTQRLGLIAREENDIFLNSSHQPGAAMGLEWNPEKVFGSMWCISSWSWEMSVNSETGVFLSPESPCRAGARGRSMVWRGSANA